MKQNFSISNLLLFHQLLNNTVNKCLDEIDEIEDKSVRLVLLQDSDSDAHTSDLYDFTNTVTNRIRTTIQIERKFLNSRTTPNFGTIKTHVVLTWDESSLSRFLETNPEIVVPLACHTFKIFFLGEVPISERILSKFWINFGVLNACFCQRGQHFAYSPFTRNEHEWGTIDTHAHINLKNLNKFPLKISMFERFPTSIVQVPELLKVNPVYKSSELVGLDGTLLLTLSSFLNFDFEFVGGLGKENFGWVLPNGTITGSLGLVAGNQVHISTNGRFLTNYRTTSIEFTVPYDSDQMCVVVPKSKKVPQWLMVFYSFSALSWVCIYSVYFICTIIWYFMGPTRRYHRVFWEMFSIIHGIPIRINPKLGQSFFLLGCMVFNIIILGLVQGSFFKSFTTPTFYHEIDTLEDLDKSGLPIGTNFYSFDSDGSKLMANLKKKKIRSVPHLMDSVAYQRNVAKLERKHDIDSFIKTHYLDQNGTPLLHIVNECLTSYFISLIVPKGSAFLDIFNEVISRLVEAGLTLKWYQDVEYTETLIRLMKLNKNKKLWEPFNLYALQGAFFVWTLGIILSSFVFLGEKLIKFVKFCNFRRCRNVFK